MPNAVWPKWPHWVGKVIWEGEWSFCLRAVYETVFHYCDKVYRILKGEMVSFTYYFVCVCAHVPTCTCTHTYLLLRKRSEVNLGYSLDTIIYLFALFFEQSLSLHNPRDPCLCLSNAGITSVHLHTQLFRWLLGIDPRVAGVQPSVLPQSLKLMDSFHTP